MSLFQPTSITPSLTGSLGNGTVDITKDLSVSWQVNGNSAMTAFQIDIYQNNTASTLVYSTGKKTDGCPFYGTDYAGNVQFFEYTIASSTLTGKGMVNGGNYKLVITQWWSSSDSVVQSSASAFITREAPVLMLNQIDSPLASRTATFTATYTQAQGDGLNWVRWQIAYADNLDDPFYDTQNIYGTAQLMATYDGFFTGYEYGVRCFVQTQNGVMADTGWMLFSVSYPTSELTGYVNATCVGYGTSAIKLEWPSLAYINGEMSGDAQIVNGVLQIRNDGYVYWDTKNGAPMNFAAPWSLIWHGETIKSDDGKYDKPFDASLFTVTTSNGTITLNYTSSEQTFTLKNGDNVLATVGGVEYDAKVWTILTPTKFYIRISGYDLTQALYPSTTLYPGTTLYPEPDLYTPFIIQQTFDLDYTQGNVQKLQLGASQNCYYVQILNKEAPAETVQAVYGNGIYTPTYDENSYLMCDFTNGLNAGNLLTGGAELLGIAVYRQQQNKAELTHIVDIALSETAVYDFAAKSQQGPYTYYLFPIGETTYVSEPLVSNSLNPCWWRWSILSCDEQADGTYSVNAEYTFDKNLSTNAVSNNNTPNIAQNFTRYPTVQLAPQNYQSGSITSLIGVIDYANDNSYSDTIAMRNAIWALSTTTDTLFLKNRKGDLLEIRIAGAITMQTMDNSREQAQTAVIPWVEVGDASKAEIVVTASQLSTVNAG